ncbi:nucleoside deaminase [Halobacteriales archaeon QH_10_67_13]|nr:MAG: nucleoside deaminase [Halobacteriales archaeon QH_10_67_13]
MDVEGTILVGETFEPVEGRMVVEDGEIRAIEETATDSSKLVVPAFVNAHTHVGDAVAKEAAVGLSLDEAVAPPESLKHDWLEGASPAAKREAMGQTLAFMAQTGTARCLDFREFGLEGARLLRAAGAESRVDPFIFGSDDPMVLDVADGYGASGANDADFAEHRAAARAADKPFAIHAGEPDATDIHPALDLEPDLLVHMVHAESEHLDRVHTTVALGTDNVMLNPPTMFREMAYTAKAFDVSPEQVLRMATRAGASILGSDAGVLEPGRPGRLLVLDGDSPNLSGAADPVAAVVRRATAADVSRVVLPSAPSS